MRRMTLLLAVFAVIAQPAPGEEPAKDPARTATIRLNFADAPWERVLKEYAKAVGKELRFESLPPGSYSNWDFISHSPADAAKILNRELATREHRLVETPTHVRVVRIRKVNEGDDEIPADDAKQAPGPPEFILRVERLAISDPPVPNELHRPLTIEFYVRPDVPFRCELTVGKETFGCHGLLRRLTDGKLWLSCDIRSVRGRPAALQEEKFPTPDQQRDARVGLLVEPGKAVAAEWLDSDPATTVPKSRLVETTRDGVRLTLSVAEESVADLLRRNPRNPIDLKPLPPANPGAPADRTCTVRMAIDGYVDDREAELPPPPDERLYALEIATGGPALFHARGLIDNRELVVAGRVLRLNPGADERAAVGFTALFKERRGANVANSSSTGGTAAIPYGEEREIGGGVTRGTKKTGEGIERVVRAKHLWKLGAFSSATTDEGSK